MAAYRRFVVLGDSQSEGLNDLTPQGPRGWADRFAEDLARTTSPGLLYANLAVRGCRATHVRTVQLPAALALEPDLASVVVGMNDVLRHDFDLEAVAADVEATISALRATGCAVVSMTFPDVARMLPVMGWLRPREETLHERLAEIASRYDVRVLELFPLAMCGDPAMWSHDRIHGSSEGHRRIAAGMAELFDLPGSDHAWAESSDAHPDLLTVVRRDAWWLATWMAPFLYRQVRGRGPVSRNVSKRPELLPVDEGSRPSFS